MIKLTKEQEELREKLERGDITDLANVLNRTTKTIQNVIRGRRKGDYVWDAISELIKDRNKKREEKLRALNP